MEAKQYKERLKKDRLSKREARERKKQEEVEANKDQTTTISRIASTTYINMIIEEIGKIIPLKKAVLCFMMRWLRFPV